jgi:hypothetical protein
MIKKIKRKRKNKSKDLPPWLEAAPLKEADSGRVAHLPPPFLIKKNKKNHHW